MQYKYVYVLKLRKTYGLCITLQIILIFKLTNFMFGFDPKIDLRIFKDGDKIILGLLINKNIKFDVIIIRVLHS